MKHSWTPKAAVARSKRNIDGAIERLRTVALEWEDIDQSFIERTHDHIRALEEFSRQIADEVKQRLDAGEHVGL